MPHQEQKQQRTAEEDKKLRPEEQFIPEQHSFGIPNSARMSTPVTLPGTPNSVMREMETDDREGLFRGRGFDTSVGAHELSHTVRRESVPSPVSTSVPSDTIQRDPDGDDDDEWIFVGGKPFEESEEVTPERLSSSIIEEKRRARGMRDVFASRHPEAMVTRLTILMREEKDPKIWRSINELKTNLEMIPSRLEEVNRHLNEAHAQLKKGGADLDSVKTKVTAASDILDELVATFNEMDYFWNNPDMFEQEREYEREMEAEVDDFELMTPGTDDEPSAADASLGTPGGDYDEPSAAAAPQGAAKPGRFRRFINFLTGKRKKEE